MHDLMQITNARIEKGEGMEGIFEQMRGILTLVPTKSKGMIIPLEVVLRKD